MNYNLKMEEQIKKIKTIPTLLLHVCCAPCSSSVLERLGQIFKITCLFYNPNITEEEEYQKRLLELKRFTKSLKTKYEVSVLEGRYNTLSPYKNSYYVNEIGKKLDEKYQSIYLYSDFKKKNGYKRSIELSKKYHLYRQDYCGCIYSKLERIAQKEKNSHKEKR